MIIDVSERIEETKRLTAEWASAAGYRVEEPHDDSLSKRARDLQRIMDVSNFGCQQKNVHSILKALIGEDFPIDSRGGLAEYARRTPFVIGSALVPVREDDGRCGIVVRVAKTGNAGIRLSNGDVGQHWQQADVRPATDAEIDLYYSELFGLSVNAADNPPPEEQEPFMAEDGLVGGPF